MGLGCAHVNRSMLMRATPCDRFHLDRFGSCASSFVVCTPTLESISACVFRCFGLQVIPWGNAESLGAFARQLNCDVLVSGHTHTFSTHTLETRLFVNPGSASGAPLVTADPPTPSFVLMDVQGATMTTYVYELIDDEVKVKKIEHQKAAAAPLATDGD